MTLKYGWLCSFRCVRKKLLKKIVWMNVSNFMHILLDIHVLIYLYIKKCLIWASAVDKPYNKTRATSRDSDSPRIRALISVFSDRSNVPCTASELYKEAFRKTHAILGGWSLLLTQILHRSSCSLLCFRHLSESRFLLDVHREEVNLQILSWFNAKPFVVTTYV